MAIDGKFVVLGLSVVIIAFAIAGLATRQWITTDNTDYGLFEYKTGSATKKIADINCNGDDTCKEFVGKTKVGRNERRVKSV
eukprot:m.85567 g.85567  ORF g.85567 m.85567 type:complete len:82 (-) comp15058_c0_seq13:63-308(-)